MYVWEWPNYPQYYIPLADVSAKVLVDEDRVQKLSRGPGRLYGLRAGDQVRPGSARVYTDQALRGFTDIVRFDWDALDAWFEEDEEVFVHPRNPYARVDAIRSTRTVRIELEGAVLALSHTEVHFDHLLPTDTVTSCPYKGTTSRYWSVRVGDLVHPDLARTYDFPTGPLLLIAGLISFYNEKVDVFLDGVHLERPVTHFSR